MENLDNGGYPTDEFLQYIRDYKFSGDKNLEEFLGELKDGWWAPEWGFILHKPRKGIRKLELHTAGWSGNESIIKALHDSFFFTVYWEKTYRGGHYFFEIPYRK